MGQKPSRDDNTNKGTILKKSLALWLTKPTSQNTTGIPENDDPNTNSSNFKWLEGRPFLNIESMKYCMPVDVQEAERLNVRHFLVRTVAQTNYFAPIKPILSRSGSKALDVGTGTGIFSMEMAQEFPECHFTALDISDECINQSDLPSNCTFVLNNALEGLPFPDDTFDYVAHRLMLTTWTVEQWPIIVKELVRVCKQGGYVELWDMDQYMLKMVKESGLSKNDNTLNYSVGHAMNARGLDPYVGRRLHVFLREAGGLKNIKARFFSIPFAWGGPLGALYKEITVSGIRTTKPWLSTVLAVSSERFDELVEEMTEEFEKKKMYMNYHQSWGRKTTTTAILEEDEEEEEEEERKENTLEEHKNKI